MIYIVTDGEYSDYHIEGVFLDKEKAYKCAELNDCIVEEYEPMDDTEIIVGRKITVDYRTKESGTMKISVKKCEIKPYYNPSTQFQLCPGGVTSLYMTRYIQDDSLSDGQIRDKYEKAARDIMDYCKERLSSGYSAHQITEFLKSKYERGKIE